MYSINTRIRYSDVTESEVLSASAMINYFQDLSTFHSVDAGADLEYLRSIHRVWMINAWQIIIHRMPHFSEEVTIATWPYGFKSVYGYRNFTIAQQGKTTPDVIANSIWILVDTGHGTPVKITEDDTRFYQLEAELSMEKPARKIAFPKDAQNCPSFDVSPSDLDSNHHVNNGKYIAMAEQFLPNGFSYRKLRTEYRNSARLGDVIYPYLSKTDSDTIYVSLANEQRTPYAIVEFSS